MSVIDWVRARWAEQNPARERSLRFQERASQGSNVLAGATMTAEDVYRAVEAKRKAQEAEQPKPTDLPRFNQVQEDLRRSLREKAAAQTITVTISVPPGSNVSVTKN